MIQIRLAEEKDVKLILEIYQPYITSTHVSFEETVPTVNDFWTRIQKIMKDYPWLVCQVGDQISGYAYATNHRERPSYGWSKEVSVYIHPNFRRHGIANGLYTALIKILELQGVMNVLAGISLPNDKSQFFHEHFGFTKVGVYSKVGYKFNSWHDVGWWELKIGDHTKAPIPNLKKMEDIMNSAEWNAAIEKGINKIKLP